MKHPPYGPSDFQKDTSVSRETLERLEAYRDLLVSWNSKVNLVGDSTIGALWWRHMLDSAQLWPLIPESTGSVLDLGSGAGFPGLVLAIMGCPEVHLVEADQRKAAFLREAARITGTPVQIHAQRIEDVTAFPASAIVARALAPLDRLLTLVEPFLGPGTICLFLKGQNVGDELTATHKMWRIALDQRPSRTDPAATILCISEVRRVSNPTDH